MRSPEYLLLSLSFLFVLVLLLLIQPSHWKRAFKVGSVGGVAGIVSEYWYFTDYWQPPSFFGPGFVFIEDFLFGFAIVGIAVLWYESLLKPEISTDMPRRTRELLLLILGACLAFGGGIFIGVNSVVVSIAVFAACALVMLVLRPDLLRVSLGTGLLLVVLMIPIYAVLNALFPVYIDTVWLLAGTSLDVRVLGDIPVTEILWYFTAGAVLGIVRPFRKGYRYRSVVAGSV